MMLLPATSSWVGISISARPVKGPENMSLRSWQSRETSSAMTFRIELSATRSEIRLAQRDRGYPDRRRHDVVRRLPHVDMVVGMDGDPLASVLPEHVARSLRD